MGLTAGISTAPPFLTPPCEEQPAEERPKVQAAALGKGRESKKGAEMEEEGSRDAGITGIPAAKLSHPGWEPHVQEGNAVSSRWV